MINKEFRTSGQIGSNGKLYIYDQSKLDFFCKKHAEHKVIIEVKVIGTDATGAIIGYFKEYVLPEFRKALMESGEYLTLEKTEEFVTELTPMLQTEVWDEKAKGWITEPKKFEDLDNYESVHCLEHLKQIAAMEYGFEIDDEQFINN